MSVRRRGPAPPEEAMTVTPFRACAGAFLLLLSAACSAPAPSAQGGAAVATSLPGGTAIALELTAPADGALVASPPGAVRVAGTVAIGEGQARPDTALVYVVDATAATSAAAACGAATTVLGCEVAALSALNARGAALGSVGEAGAVLFAGGGQALDVAPAAGAQRLVAPGADGNAAGGPDVVEALESVRPGGTAARFDPVAVGTGLAQVGSGLQAAFDVAGLSSLAARTVVLLSASTSAAGPGPADLVAPAGVVVRAFALPGTTCAAGLAAFAARGAGGSGCEDVADLSTLPARLLAVLDATLDSLDLAIDGGAPVPIDPAGLPTPAPYAGPFATLASGLAPGIHELCVRATGRDAGGVGTAVECVSVKVATLAVAPPAATYELGTPGQTATVTATVAAGAAGGVAGVDVEFLVTAGPNAGKGRTVTTDAAGRAAFTYEARQHLEGLGTDGIQACFADAAGTKACAAATVRWQDTTPPVVACLPGPNPGGNVVTKQGGPSPSGFMLLVATDAVDPAPVVFLVDTGSGTVRGPWASGKAVKYTQAPGGPPSAKDMGSDEGGGVEILHVKGTGDPALRGRDAVGNVSADLVCAVPPWKK
jgi:hypothetical protein